MCESNIEIQQKGDFVKVFTFPLVLRTENMGGGYSPRAQLLPLDPSHSCGWPDPANLHCHLKAIPCSGQAQAVYIILLPSYNVSCTCALGRSSLDSINRNK